MFIVSNKLRFCTVAFALATALALCLSGCSVSSLDWKSGFEKSDAFQRVLPANDHVKESPYKVTDFRTEVNKSSSNPDRQTCNFGATIENDYFVMEVSGTGEEISKDGDMKFEVSQRQYCKAKAAINVLDDSEWYLNDLAFTLNDDGTGCSADVNKDIETWFGTIHAEGKIEAELDNASNSNPSKQPRWSETSDVELSMKKFSASALGEYKFSRGMSDALHAGGIVKQVQLKESTPGLLGIEFEQPEFSHIEFSRMIIGTPALWESPSRHATLTEENGSGWVSSADGSFLYKINLSESYPCPHDADYEMKDGVAVSIDSNVEGEVRLEGSFSASLPKPKALGGGDDKYRIMDANKNDFLLLNGIYSK